MIKGFIMLIYIDDREDEEFDRDYGYGYDYGCEEEYDYDESTQINSYDYVEGEESAFDS